RGSAGGKPQANRSTNRGSCCRRKSIRRLDRRLFLARQGPHSFRSTLATTTGCGEQTCRPPLSRTKPLRKTAIEIVASTATVAQARGRVERGRWALCMAAFNDGRLRWTHRAGRRRSPYLNDL